MSLSHYSKSQSVQTDLEFTINYKKYSTHERTSQYYLRSLLPPKKSLHAFKIGIPKKSISLIQNNYHSDYELKSRQKSCQQIQSTQACYLFQSKRLRTYTRNSTPNKTIPPNNKSVPNVVSQKQTDILKKPKKMKVSPIRYNSNNSQINYSEECQRLIDLLNKQNKNPGIFLRLKTEF